MPLPHHVPIVEATRGPIVESIHYGSIAVCDPTGKLVAFAGDVDAVIYLRSSSKPFQALPLVELGGMERFGLTDRELAVMCASHHGTDEHVRVIEGLQRKIGITPEDLLCGIHPPSDEHTAERMLVKHEPNSPLRHNCSGKHTGMLAQAILQGFEKEDYLNPAHPVQQRIIRTFSEITGIPMNQIILGIDGCSAPVFAIPLRAAAFAFARFADPSLLPEPRRSALQRIFRAMTTNPDMIAGPDSFDTNLMTACRGLIATKGGAEGYQAVTVLPGACGQGSPAYGITLKISDGDLSERARSTAAVEVLRQLGALDEALLKDLAPYLTRPQYNWRRIQVGEIRPAFDLKRY